MSELLDYGLVRRLQARVADLQLADRQQLQEGGVPVRSPEDEQQYAHRLIRQVVSEHLQEQLARGHQLPADNSYDMRLRAAVHSAIYGAGELQQLLDDERIENIDINGCRQVWVTYEGGIRRQVLPVAATDEDLISLVQNLGAYAGINARPFSPATPELDVRLKDGSRLSAVMSATETPSVSIRRNRYPQMFLRPDLAQRAGGRPGGPPLPDLVTLGTVTEEVADFLYAAVRARCNIMIGGATDAGKTTLARALINCIDPLERLVTIEQSLELCPSRHPELHRDVREMEVVLPDAEGRGGVDIAALVRRSRRMNPSRVIVGEVLGPEVVEMLSAMAQGNDGSLSTIHARDAEEVFNRISTYAVQHGMGSFDVAHALIAGSIDFVVYVEKNPKRGMHRDVTQIIEVSGLSDGRVGRAKIFEPGEDGRATRARTVGIARRDKLTRAGFSDGVAAWSADSAPGGW